MTHVSLVYFSTKGFISTLFLLYCTRLMVATIMKVLINSSTMRDRKNHTNHDASEDIGLTANHMEI